MRVPTEQSCTGLSDDAGHQRLHLLQSRARLAQHRRDCGRRDPKSLTDPAPHPLGVTDHRAGGGHQLAVAVNQGVTRFH